MRIKNVRSKPGQKDCAAAITEHDSVKAAALAAIGTLMDPALTTQQPALTASFLAAILLAIVARFFNLTDDDLSILGPIALIVAGVVIRSGVFSPATVDDLVRPK